MARKLRCMYALGRDEMPATLDVGGRSHALECVVKHDFWAATGFYRDADGARVVVKINRRASLLGLPMRWTGRWLRRREVRAYRALADLPNVPALLGDATDTGLVHAYVEGAPLQRGQAVPDGFFDELLAVLHELARRGFAYVDANKPENVILGGDGRPHLIDFQISFDARARWPPALGRALLSILTRADAYHALKLKRRFRPDLLTDAERAIVERPSGPIRAHRTLVRPYSAVRRPMMRWLRRGGWIGEAGSN